MEEISLDEQVTNLERRVEFLEAELETSYEEERFSRRINSIFPDEASIETREGGYGLFARVTDITGDDVQIALERLDNTPYGTAVTETNVGLGMEIWSEGQF